jgi:hypothetical protein
MDTFNIYRNIIIQRELRQYWVLQQSEKAKHIIQFAFDADYLLCIVEKNG